MDFLSFLWIPIVLLVGLRLFIKGRGWLRAQNSLVEPESSIANSDDVPDWLRPIFACGRDVLVDELGFEPGPLVFTKQTTGPTAHLPNWVFTNASAKTTAFLTVRPSFGRTPFHISFITDFEDGAWLETVDGIRHFIPDVAKLPINDARTADPVAQCEAHQKLVADSEKIPLPVDVPVQQLLDRSANRMWTVHNTLVDDGWLEPCNEPGESGQPHWKLTPARAWEMASTVAQGEQQLNVRMQQLAGTNPETLRQWPAEAELAAHDHHLLVEQHSASQRRGK